MQPCKILCGKLEINFSVLPLPSPCCLKPNTVQQHPLCLDPCQHQNFSLSKNSCQHLKICLASSREQRKKCLRYHLIPPGSHALLRENPTETASPLATQTSRVNCSAQEVMQNSPSRSSFFFFLITQLCLIGKSNHLRNVPLAWAILMNFHRFPCIAVASLVLVPEVHTVQAAVKARMNKGNSTNINLVGKCCSALHKFSIRVLIRDITTPKPSTPCR